MKLLLDHNLSPRLVERLGDVYPDLLHVRSSGLDRASDEVVWRFSLEQGCMIVTKDSDFSDLAVLRGMPPKVIWLRIGNCTTGRIEEVLRNHHSDLEAFWRDPEAALLTLM